MALPALVDGFASDLGSLTGAGRTSRSGPAGALMPEGGVRLVGGPTKALGRGGTARKGAAQSIGADSGRRLSSDGCAASAGDVDPPWLLERYTSAGAGRAAPSRSVLTRRGSGAETTTEEGGGGTTTASWSGRSSAPPVASTGGVSSGSGAASGSIGCRPATSSGGSSLVEGTDRPLGIRRGHDPARARAAWPALSQRPADASPLTSLAPHMRCRSRKRDRRTSRPFR